MKRPRPQSHCGFGWVVRRKQTGRYAWLRVRSWSIYLVTDVTQRAAAREDVSGSPPRRPLRDMTYLLLVVTVNSLVDEQAGLGQVVGEHRKKFVFENAVNPFGERVLLAIIAVG